MNKAKTPSLTFVVILYNASTLVESTLGRLVAAIDQAGWTNADVLVVDDGSTDDTVAVIEQYKKTTKVPIAIFRQKNSGRLMASKNGVKRANGEYVSLIGSRVFMDKNSLVFLRKQLEEHKDRQVWNCHINVVKKGNIQAQFWHVVTYVAWRKYLRKPKLVSYDSEDFDYYPKGTGGFICPKKLLLESYKHIDSIYTDNKYSSDDTTLIRNIAVKQRIYMSPKYSADYIARSNIKSFIKHTYDRGTFLLDSYMRPGTRFYWPIIIFFVLFIPALVLLLLQPILFILLPVVLVVLFIALVSIGVKASDSFGFCVALPGFALVYSAGMWKGLLLFAKGRFSYGA